MQSAKHYHWHQHVLKRTKMWFLSSKNKKSERALRYTLTVPTHYTVNTRWFFWSSINLLAGGRYAEMLLRQIFSSLPPQSAMSVHKRPTGGTTHSSSFASVFNGFTHFWNRIVFQILLFFELELITSSGWSLHSNGYFISMITKQNSDIWWSQAHSDISSCIFFRQPL